tara:strand:- start:2254 stop:3393 length:1140 start_codon:yes stop_codon:yes gene_type:complete
MAIKISELANITATVQGLTGNVYLPMVGNLIGLPTTLKSTVDELKTFVVAQTDANVAASNSATAFANTIMKGYVDGQVAAANVGTGTISYVNGQISAVNAATTLSNTIVTAGIVTANTGMIGFVGLANTITATGITRSNLALKGYTDFANTVQDSVITSRVNTANIGQIGYTLNLVTVANTIVTAGIVTANIGQIGYTDNKVSVANTIVTAGIVTANIGQIGYTDNKVSVANIGQIGYTDNKVTTANIGQIGYTDNKVSVANIGIKGYIDDADITSAYQITNPSANVALTIAATNTRLLVAPTSDPAPVSFFTDVTLPNTVQDGRMLTISSNVQIQFLRTISPWVSTVTRLGNVALGANTEVKLMFVGGGTGGIWYRVG